MSLNPRVCKKSYKVHIPMMGEACEFWLITVTDEQSITNPDKDHAYLTDDGKLFVFNGDSLVRVNCDICFTQEEREKLEGIEEGANKYVLPVASSTELGGVLLGYTQNGRNYPITKDTKGNIYVNVPWEEYQLPKATDNALGGIKTGYKQNGKFYPIKTDTDGNAYVQVPWEDTNTVYEVVSKTSNGLMPMLPSDENASKRFLNGDGEWVVGTDNSINGVTQTGSTFSGETSDCGVEITKVVGKTTQQTTKGYQLFDASKIATKTQGGATVTNNGDGSFTISGSGNLTSAYTDYKQFTHEQLKQLLKVGTIRLKTENIGQRYVVPNLYFSINDATTGKSAITVYENQSLTIKQEYLDDEKYVFRIGFYADKGSTITPNTFKPMLYQDGDGTWEPYTGAKPAPNGDYPMEIKNVEITEIKSTGKNLIPFPYDIGGVGSKNSTNGINFEVMSDKGVKLSGTATESAHINLCVIDFGDTNFLSSTMNATNGYQATLVGNKTGLFLGYNGSNKRTSISINKGVSVNQTVYPMIEKGDVKTEWEEPKGYNTVETSLTLAQDDIYHQEAITRDRKQVTFDGSSDEGWLNLVANTRVQCQLDTVIRANYAINVNGYCNRAVYRKTGNANALKNNEFTIMSSKDFGGTRLIIRIPSDISTLEEWKTWLSTHNTVVEYELATPTTEEIKVPTIPSYYPYTNVFTDSEVEPEITFRPLPFTTCLVGEATEEESGYMPPLSGNSSEFLNGNGEWTTPSGYTLPTASSSTLGGVKIGSNISISSGKISIDKENVTGALGYTPPTTNTTYNLATTSANGLLRQLNGNANSFMAGNGNWKDIISVIDSRISAKILTFFPVGTVIQTTNSANPSTYLGGTWEAFAPGRVLIGAGQGNDGTTSMSFTSLGTYGKYKHQHNPGTLGADWNHFVSGNRMYMDYREINNGTNYLENMRLYIGSSDLQSLNDRTDSETNASQIGISGKTENTDNIMPGIGVYMFRRTA